MPLLPHNDSCPPRQSNQGVYFRVCFLGAIPYLGHQGADRNIPCFDAKCGRVEDALAMARSVAALLMGVKKDQ